MACGDAPLAALALRRRFLAAAVAWVAIAMALAWTVCSKRWDMRPPPLMGLLVCILALGPIIARSEAGDRLSRGLPLAALVGLQSFRLPLEVLMHRAAEDGVMPVQMSYSGLNFDIVTGATAVMLAVWLRAGHPPRAVVRAWNILGLAAARQYRHGGRLVDAGVRRVRIEPGPTQHVRHGGPVRPVADRARPDRLGRTPDRVLAR